MAEKIFTEGEEGRRIKLEPSSFAQGVLKVFTSHIFNRFYPQLFLFDPTVEKNISIIYLLDPPPMQNMKGSSSILLVTSPLQNCCNFQILKSLIYV